MTLIASLDNVSIYNAYKTQFELLASKGFKHPNQMSWIIKQQNTSRLILPKMIASCNWWSPTTIASTLLNM
jgi:hypothetical protein